MFPGETTLSGGPLYGREFVVCKSAAGHFIGTRDEHGPCTRESLYCVTEGDADYLLTQWQYTVTADPNEPITSFWIDKARAMWENDMLPQARA